MDTKKGLAGRIERFADLQDARVKGRFEAWMGEVCPAAEGRGIAILDVTFGEDASLIRLRHAAQNFSFLRRLALNLFRADKSRSSRYRPTTYRPAAQNLMRRP